MKPDQFKEEVLGSLPEQGFTLSVARAQALREALGKLQLPYNTAAEQAAYELAAVLEREQESTAPARELLRTLVDRVELGHQTSLSVMRFTKF